MEVENVIVKTASWGINATSVPPNISDSPAVKLACVTPRVLSTIPATKMENVRVMLTWWAKNATNVRMGIQLFLIATLAQPNITVTLIVNLVIVMRMAQPINNAMKMENVLVKKTFLGINATILRPAIMDFPTHKNVSVTRKVQSVKIAMKTAANVLANQI